MKRTVHYVDQLLHDRNEATSKAKRARGPRQAYWQDRVTEIDRLLALPTRGTRTEANPMGGGDIEREVVFEVVAQPPRFKAGNVVQLLSGGHSMTVIGVGPACDGSGETVTVMWSTDRTRIGEPAAPNLSTRNIPPACLRIVDQDIPF
jgi:hypothetical protein